MWPALNLKGPYGPAPVKVYSKHTLHIERLTSKVAFTASRLLRSLSFMKTKQKKHDFVLEIYYPLNAR
jgi:hypothetical protein